MHLLHFVNVKKRGAPFKAPCGYSDWDLNLFRIATDGTVSVTMFFLVGHDRQTFAIDLEPHRLEGQFAYKLDQTFDLVARLQPLGELEVRLPPQAQVTAAFSYEIDSWACGSGVIIKPIRYTRITDPLPKRMQPNDEEEDVIVDDVEGDIGACSEDDDECVVGAFCNIK